MNGSLSSLLAAGQSIWYDNVSKELLDDGSIAALIDEGVRGLTSNPTIFDKAVSSSDSYDESIRSLSQQGQSAEQIAEELMAVDIQRVCDLLMPIYEESSGTDGYASIEVSPKLADDTQGTVAAAERLWARIERPNVMIKIPATEAGLGAIEESLKKGMNVNVTLIFSVQRYREVASAFVSAQKQRVSDGKSVDRLASVASFFVSRVDVLFDALLAEKGVSEGVRAELIGPAGVANSRLAYRAYQEIFESAEERSFRAQHTGQVQRPLWASTSSKSDHLPETYYVENLVAPNTVNTVPPKTLSALMEALSFETFSEEQYQTAQDTLAEISAQDISLESAFDRLLSEGVSSFAKSFDSLLSSIDGKMKALS